MKIATKITTFAAIAALSVPAFAVSPATLNELYTCHIAADTAGLAIDARSAGMSESTFAHKLLQATAKSKTDRIAQDRRYASNAVVKQRFRVTAIAVGHAYHSAPDTTRAAAQQIEFVACAAAVLSP